MDDTRRGLQIAVLLAPIVAVVIVAWTRRWIEEDAFLNFRVVDQIRAGHGPVFNIGERVEITTSTLWLGILVAMKTVLPFVSLEYLSIAGGLVFTSLGLWWAQNGAAQMWRRNTEWFVVPFGAALFVAIPAQWDWTTSGLENGLSIAWLGAVTLVLAKLSRRDPGRRRGLAPMSLPRLVLAGVVLGLGPLVRPDLAIMSITAVLAVLIVRRPRWSQAGAFLGGVLALPVAVEIFRIGYYAALVPNTALAKDSGGVYWEQGWQYFLDFTQTYWLLIPAIACAVAIIFLLVGRARPPIVIVLALPIGGLLHSLYMIRNGGDYLHGRLLLPSLFALLAPVAAVPWRRRMVLPLATGLVWLVIVLTSLRPHIHPNLVPYTSYDVVEGRKLMQELGNGAENPVMATDFGYADGPTAREMQRQGKHAFVTTSGSVVDATPGRTVLLATASGISGFRAGPDVIAQEYYGLADPILSRLTPLKKANAGHRKGADVDWIYALRLKPGVPGYDNARVVAARRALHCGDLAELLKATRGPIDVGDFVSNATHAADYTSIVIPRDPFKAERKFCGTTPPTAATSSTAPTSSPAPTPTTASSR